jgi:Clp amino terminal domain, pathogenicity island component
MTPAPSLQALIESVRADAGAGDTLAQLAQASRTVSDLEELSDALLGHFVDRCRHAGHSWSEISSALGVSKQAAHKRFSPGAPTFERFTPRARSVLSGAADEARGSGERAVGPEHLVLALFRPPDSLAAIALAKAGLTRALVQEQLAMVPGRGPGVGAGSGPGAGGTSEGGQGAGAEDRLPFRPDAVEVLRRAMIEALELRHNYVGTEHLLLALLHDPETPAATALAALGVTDDRIRSDMLALLARYTNHQASND